MPLSSGQLISQRYKVAKVLGQGGFGAVYLVEDTRLSGRKVALKETFDTKPEAVKQFQLEAELLARLNHPGLVRVSDRFEERGHQFLVMDFVEGEDLTDAIVRGSASPEQIIRWMIEVCDAVAYLHSQNPPIIHRDIKPPNIKIRKDGHAILVDFGIAKLGGAQKLTAMVAKAISSGFSPPEQYQSGTDTQTDVYSLGATLYCALTGTVPPEALELVDGSAVLPRPSQINRRISPAIEQVILKAMSLNMLVRYRNAGEMKQALEAALGGAGAGAPSVPVPPIQQPSMPIQPGAMQGIRCPRCGQMNRPTAKFCQYDRTPLAPASAMPSPLPTATPQMSFEQGNRHFHKKNFKRAVEEYARALQGGYEQVALYYNLAGAYIELSRVSEAIPVLQRGVGKYPNDAGLYALLGLAYTNMNQLPQAELVLKRAMQLDSQNFEAHLFMSLMCRKGKRLDEAVRWAKKATSIEPGVSIAHFVLGQSFEAMKKWNDAIASFKQAAQLEPKDPDPHLHLAVCYVALNRRREARDEAQRALQIDPKNKDAQELLDKI